MLAVVLVLISSLTAQHLTVLLRATNVSADIASVMVNEQEAGVMVSVYGRRTLNASDGYETRILTANKVRVWLLRADGSAVRQLQPANNVAAGTPPLPETINFLFAKTPRVDLRGVVVELDARMFVLGFADEALEPRVAVRGGLIEGLETLTCEAWTQNKRIPRELTQFNLYPTLTTWFVGFTFGARSTGPQLRPVTPAEAVSAMDQYCAEHPKASLQGAATAVVSTFVKR